MLAFLLVLTLRDRLISFCCNVHLSTTSLSSLGRQQGFPRTETSRLDLGHLSVGYYRDSLSRSR